MHSEQEENYPQPHHNVFHHLQKCGLFFLLLLEMKFTSTNRRTWWLDKKEKVRGQLILYMKIVFNCTFTKLTKYFKINYFPYFWKSHSQLHNGQTCLVFNHLEIQWKWKAWLQTPQATVHSSLVADCWLAVHSIQSSMMWFLQMAQESTTIKNQEIIN